MIESQLFQRTNLTNNYKLSETQISFLKSFSPFQVKLDIIFFILLSLIYLSGCLNYLLLKNIFFLSTSLTLFTVNMLIFIFLLRQDGKYSIKIFLKYFMLLCSYSVILWEIASFNSSSEIDNNIIKCLKSFYKLIIFSSISLCLLLEMNLISMLIFCLINSFFIFFFCQIFFSIKFLIYIQIVFVNLILFIVLGFIRYNYQTLINLNYEDNERDKWLNTHVNSLLSDLKAGYLLYDGKQYFCNDFFEKILNQISPSQDEVRLSIMRSSENEEILQKKETNFTNILGMCSPKIDEILNNKNFFSIYNYRITDFMKKLNTFKNDESITLKNMYEETLMNFPQFQKMNISKLISLGKFQNDRKTDLTMFLDIYIRIISNLGPFDEKVVEFFVYNNTDELKKEEISRDSQFRHQILAKFAHEFKTPLLSIISLIDDLRETTKSNEQYMSHIVNLSNYTLTLISNIIEYSKIKDVKNLSSLEKSQNMKVFTIKDFFEFCFCIMKSLIKLANNREHSVKPILDIQSSLLNLSLYSDEFKLKQILLNLISNSIKFTKSGFVKLGIMKTDDSTVMIYVEDTGIGILESDRLNLFKDHFNIKNKEYENNLGSGLGLSISQYFAKQIDTTINLETEYGIGSKFYFFLKNACRENESDSCNMMKNISFFNLSQIKSKFYNKSAFNSNEKIGKSGRNILISEKEISPEKSQNEGIKESENNLNDHLVELSEKLEIRQDLNHPLSHLDFKLSPEFNDNTFKCKGKMPKRKYRSYKVINVFFKDILNSPNHIRLQSSSSCNSDKTIVDPLLPCSNKLNYDVSIKKSEEPKCNKILIVDDCISILDSLSKILMEIIKESNSDIKVIKGNDGIDTLKLVYDDQFQDSSIKLIISDENMEFLNGSESFKILKKLEKSTKIKPIKFAILTSDLKNDYYQSIGIDKIIDKKYDKNCFRYVLKDLSII